MAKMRAYGSKSSSITSAIKKGILGLFMLGAAGGITGHKLNIIGFQSPVEITESFKLMDKSAEIVEIQNTFLESVSYLNKEIDVMEHLENYQILFRSETVKEKIVDAQRVQNDLIKNIEKLNKLIISEKKFNFLNSYLDYNKLRYNKVTQYIDTLGRILKLNQSISDELVQLEKIIKVKDENQNKQLIELLKAAKNENFLYVPRLKSITEITNVVTGLAKKKENEREMNDKVLKKAQDLTISLLNHFDSKRIEEELKDFIK